MADDKLNSESLVPIRTTGLAKVGNSLKITKKLLRQLQYVPFLKKNGKYIFVNADSMNPIWGEGEFEDTNIDYDDFVRVKSNNKWVLINNEVTIIVLPRYDRIIRFLNGFAKVELNKKWGYIDEAGKEVISPKYDDADFFTPRGFTTVKLNKKCGYIDKRGNEIIPLIYDVPASPDEGYCYFKDGLARVKRQNKW